MQENYYQDVSREVLDDFILKFRDDLYPQLKKAKKSNKLGKAYRKPHTPLDESILAPELANSFFEMANSAKTRGF